MLDFFRAAPGGVPTQVAFSQDQRYPELDLDRSGGVIRNVEHAFSKDGGLAVLYGNIAADGCIVKTAGVDESIWKFSGRARVFESQDAAVEAILGSIVVAQEKATTALKFKRSSKAFEDMVTGGRNAVLSLPGVVAIEGGLPLIVDGAFIGAIGISGAKSSEDGVIAQAGLAALAKP